MSRGRPGRLAPFRRAGSVPLFRYGQHFLYAVRRHAAARGALLRRLRPAHRRRSACRVARRPRARALGARPRGRRRGRPGGPGGRTRQPQRAAAERSAAARPTGAGPGRRCPTTIRRSRCPTTSARSSPSSPTRPREARRPRGVAAARLRAVPRRAGRRHVPRRRDHDLQPHPREAAGEPRCAARARQHRLRPQRPDQARWSSTGAI